MCGNDQHAVLVDAVIATELLRNGDTELHVQSEKLAGQVCYVPHAPVWKLTAGSSAIPLAATKNFDMTQDQQEGGRVEAQRVEAHTQSKRQSLTLITCMLCRNPAWSWFENVSHEMSRRSVRRQLRSMDPHAHVMNHPAEMRIKKLFANGNCVSCFSHVSLARGTCGLQRALHDQQFCWKREQPL